MTSPTPNKKKKKKQKQISLSWIFDDKNMNYLIIEI